MVEIKDQKEKTAIEVGERIRYFRLKCNFSQEALALRIGMNPSYIGHLERGLKCPTIDTLLSYYRCNGDIIAGIFCL